MVVQRLQQLRCAMIWDLMYTKKQKKKPFKFICLNENQSILTAIGNDIGYEKIFLNQLKIHFRPKKDAILILSASGNSKNLIEAATWVKKIKEQFYQSSVLMVEK